MVDSPNSRGALVSELAGDADLAALVELFVDELPDKVSNIKRALANRDFETLRMLAHQLKGSGGGYGFPSITETARELEMAAKAHQDLERVAAHVNELSALCARARATPAGGPGHNGTR